MGFAENAEQRLGQLLWVRWPMLKALEVLLSPLGRPRCVQSFLTAPSKRIAQRMRYLQQSLIDS